MKFASAAYGFAFCKASGVRVRDKAFKAIKEIEAVMKHVPY